MSIFLEANVLEQQRLAPKSQSRQPLRHWVKSCLRIIIGHVASNVSPPTRQRQPYADNDSILCISATGNPPRRSQNLGSVRSSCAKVREPVPGLY
jgi:hypothetical protein